MKETNDKYSMNPAQWVEEYGDQLYTYAYYRSSSAQTAEDLVQDTFVAALKAKNSFEGRSSVKTWLFSILKRKIVDYYRSKAKHQEIDVENEDLPFIREGAKKGEWDKERVPLDWTKEGIGELDKEEFYKILELCLSLLPEKWNAVFFFFSMEEISTAKICKELGLTSSNIWVILHRARLRLRECFEKKWV